MVWFAVPNAVPLAVTWPLSTLALPLLALAVAAVPAGVVVYKALRREAADRPTLRVVEGGRTELRLKPA